MDNYTQERLKTNKKRRENIILYLIKNYLIYVIMAASIGAAIFFSEFLKEHIDNIKIDVDKFKQQDKKRLCLPIILIIVAILIIFVGWAVKGSKDFKKSEDKKIQHESSKTYVKKLTKLEYERVKAETTQKELDKLYGNPEFRKLLTERGNDSKKWAWQSREKEKRVVYRNNDYSDDISNLSQITLSDD